MKILLVDDETSVLQGLMGSLRGLDGHEVRPAISAEKALVNAESLGGVDMLITDVVMEPMNGFQLRDELAARYPGLRAIFLTEYDLSEYSEMIGGSPVLAKPVEPETLIAAVRSEAAAALAPVESARVEEAPQVESVPVNEAPPGQEEAPAFAEAPAAPVEEAAPATAEEPATPESVPVAEAPAPAPEPQPEPAPAPAPVAVPVGVPVAVPKAVPVAVPRAVPAAAAAVPAVKAVPAQPRVVPAATAVPAAPRAVPAPAAAPAAPKAVPTVAAVPAAPKAVPAVAAAPAAPKAVPAAVPSAPKVVAAPTAVPAAPRAVAAPTAVPVAPKAVPAPVAVPVAKPVQAVPAAPTVSAVPAAPQAPTAVPVAARAAAVPVAPKAVPAAPKVVSAAVPATPKAVATPAAVPSAPRVVAAPKAVPAAPKAVPAAPRAVPAAQPVARPAAVPVAPVLPEAFAEEVPGVPVAEPIPAAAEPSAVALSLIGQMIGGYQIVSVLGQGRWGPVFAAVQVSINRPVGLKVLDPERAADEVQKARFIADARAKANVQHPSILSVFEAGSADQWIFYTHEYVDGQSLAEMAASGRKIDQPTALKMVKGTAEGMLYYEKNHVPHTPLEAGDVFLGADGLPRLANLAIQLADQPTNAAEEMDSLGRAIMAVLPPGAAVTPAMRALLGRTQRKHNAPLATWEALLQGVKALEPKVIPVEAAKISAQDRAAVEAVAKARAQQQRAFLINVGAMASLVLLAAYAFYYVAFRSNERRLEVQVHIPAGEFPFGTGKMVTLPEFWIDKYEVTVGQYAKFVAFIEANPGEEHTYDHPDQPRGLTHVPDYWNIYYLNAIKQTQVRGVDQSLNSPVMVNWWSAYAYAKWKGRELPTEHEWERAARGKKGQAYTYGEDPDPKKANTNSDHNANNPRDKAKVDGYNFWGDVDGLTKDKSPDGVVGMQGNVSEWTGSWATEPKHPVIKGGNYSIPLQPLSSRIIGEPPQKQHEWLGFRTVSREAPKK